MIEELKLLRMRVHTVHLLHLCHLWFFRTRANWISFFLIDCLTISWSSFGAVLFVSWYSPLRLPQGLLQRSPQRPPQAKALRSGLAGTTWKKQTQRDCFDANVIFLKKVLFYTFFPSISPAGIPTPAHRRRRRLSSSEANLSKTNATKMIEIIFYLYFFQGIETWCPAAPWTWAWRRSASCRGISSRRRAGGCRWRTPPGSARTRCRRRRSSTGTGSRSGRSTCG